MRSYLDEEMKGVCEVCGVKTTKTCSRCKATYFCSVKCQKSVWESHKVECVVEKAIARSLGGGLEEQVLRYASMDRSPPAGATCWICLEESSPENKLLAQGCGCRGDAGWCHVACLFRGMDQVTAETLRCRICTQQFYGEFYLRLVAASWRRHRRNRTAARTPKELELVFARINCLDLLSSSLKCYHQFDAALLLRREVLKYARDECGVESIHFFANVHKLASCLNVMHKYAETCKLLAPYAMAWRDELDPLHRQVKLYSLATYCQALVALGDLERARVLLGLGYQFANRFFPPNARVVTELGLLLAQVLRHQSHFDQALAVAQACYRRALRVSGPDHPNTKIHRNVVNDVIHAQNLHRSRPNPPSPLSQHC